MESPGSFGAGRSGSTIDPITFAKQPQTILRVLSWVSIFSLVVFASIVNEGYVNLGSERLHCVFNKNADACNYGVFMGLVGLLACSFFFMLDYKFSSISSVKDRKKAIMLEIGFSGSWTFLYFVGFCFLANQWSRTTAADLPLNQGADAARAAIAFSFFSIITWVRTSNTPPPPPTTHTHTVAPDSHAGDKERLCNSFLKLSDTIILQQCFNGLILIRTGTI
uniref:Synaptogyrin 3a n=1 Tax=Cyclopterus lumpus TaxID=8103 RepID=A0A8C2XEI6_CYCLU